MILGTACSASTQLMGEIAERIFNITQVKSLKCSTWGIKHLARSNMVNFSIETGSSVASGGSEVPEKFIKNFDWLNILIEQSTPWDLVQCSKM